MTGIPEWVDGFLVNEQFYRYTYAVDIYMLGLLLNNDLHVNDALVQKMLAKNPDERPTLSDVSKYFKNV